MYKLYTISELVNYFNKSPTTCPLSVMTVRTDSSLIPRPLAFLPFAFTIIHESRIAAKKNGEGLDSFITRVAMRWT